MHDSQNTIDTPATGGIEAILSQVRSRAANPIDDRESRSCAAFVDHVASIQSAGGNPLDEGVGRVHVTGSAIVLGSRGVLLHLHKRAAIWIQPGGHVDPGEMPWEGARRETFEETGLWAEHPDDGPTLIHVDVHEAPKGHLHLDLRYLLIGPDEDPAPPVGESQQVAWFSATDELIRGRDSLAGAVQSAVLAASASGSVTDSQGPEQGREQGPERSGKQRGEP